MTPLERAARALFDLTTQEMGADAGGPDQIEEQWARSKPQYLDRARAVLEAIREPSGYLLHEIRCCTTVDAWQTMIDAASETDDAKENWEMLKADGWEEA